MKYNTAYTQQKRFKAFSPVYGTTIPTTSRCKHRHAGKAPKNAATGRTQSVIS